MIDKIYINHSQCTSGLQKSPSKQPDSTKIPPNNSADVSLQVDYIRLINQAIQVPQTDTEAVQRAQELLRSGKLESPEYTRKAAKNIITSGI